MGQLGASHGISRNVVRQGDCVVGGSEERATQSVGAGSGSSPRHHERVRRLAKYSTVQGAVQYSYNNVGESVSRLTYHCGVSLEQVGRVSGVPVILLHGLQGGQGFLDLLQRPCIHTCMHTY